MLTPLLRLSAVFGKKITWVSTFDVRIIMYMPDKFQACQLKVIVLKLIKKNVELRAFIPFPFSMLPNFSLLVWHIFNLCYTPETTRHNSVCTCPIWLKIVPNWSAIDHASKHEFVTSQLYDVMSIKLKINLKHTFLFIQHSSLWGEFFLFIINPWNFIYMFLISPTYFPANSLRIYLKLLIAYQGMVSFPENWK